MRNLSKMNGEEVARVLDTEGARFALDVGGASGDLLHSVMLANPKLEGAVLDMAHVLPDAVAAASEKGLQDRFSVVEGDFFQKVPPADLYLLRYILHDWSNEQCAQILKNCRASLAEGGRVAVVDHLIGKISKPGVAPLMDMNMLVMLTGRERGIDEFDALFTAAGLRRIRVTPAGNMALIEAVAADLCALLLCSTPGMGERLEVLWGRSRCWPRAGGHNREAGPPHPTLPQEKDWTPTR